VGKRVLPSKRKKLAEITEEEEAFRFISNASMKKFGMKIVKRGFGINDGDVQPYLKLTFADHSGNRAVARLTIEPVGEC